MRRFLTYILSVAFLLAIVSGKADAQTCTTFAKTVFDFNSTPKGLKVMYMDRVVGTTPCKVELKAPYLFDCDRDDMCSMSEKEIEAYNSNKIEAYIKSTGKKQGTFPNGEFAMRFRLVMEDGDYVEVVCPLQWEPSTALGMPATKVFYNTEVNLKISDVD